MKEKNMKRNYHTNWNKLSEMNDKDIDLSDIPELKLSFFKNAQLKMPKPKSLISLRIDPETIEWFKHQGRGYQTRINAVLRMYMLAHQK